MFFNSQHLLSANIVPLMQHFPPLEGVAQNSLLLQHCNPQHIGFSLSQHVFESGQIMSPLVLSQETHPSVASLHISSLPTLDEQHIAPQLFTPGQG